MNQAPTALTEPRSFAGIAFRIGAMTFLPFALFMAWIVSCLTGYDFVQVLPLALGGSVLFSTVFGLNNARFLQVETVTIDVENRATLIAMITLASSRLGYYPACRWDDYVGYSPSFQTGWAAGWISVQFLENQAVIVGPRVFVRKLLEGMSLLTQLRS